MRSSVALVTAAVAVLVAAAVAVVGLRSTPAVARPGAGMSAASPHPLSRSGVSKQPPPHSVDLAGGAADATVPAPTSVVIPSIGVNASLVDLGLNPDGSAAVPSSTTSAGWYDLGPRPGQNGPAVILGHVDSYTGPAVFYRLKDLRAGDMIQVVSGPRTESFVVQHVDLVAKQAFPTAEVFGPVPQKALRLVTCGGPFDSSVRSYQDNWIVFAVEVS